MTYLNIMESESCWPWDCCKTTIKNNEYVYIRSDSSVVKLDFSKNLEKSLNNCSDRLNQIFLQQVGQRVFVGQYIARIASETGIAEDAFRTGKKLFTRAEIENIKQAMATIPHTKTMPRPAILVTPMLVDKYIV